MYYILILMFIGFSISNLRTSRGRIIGTEVKPVYNIILIMAGIIYIFMAYKLDRALGSYMVGISAVFYLFTTIYCQGIGKEGFYVILGKSFIKKISFDKINDIKINQKNQNLNIYANSDIYKQRYKKEDFPKVLDIIENFK